MKGKSRKACCLWTAGLGLVGLIVTVAALGGLMRSLSSGDAFRELDDAVLPVWQLDPSEPKPTETSGAVEVRARAQPVMAPLPGSGAEGIQVSLEVRAGVAAQALSVGSLEVLKARSGTGAALSILPTFESQRLEDGLVSIDRTRPGADGTPEHPADGFRVAFALTAPPAGDSLLASFQGSLSLHLPEKTVTVDELLPVLETPGGLLFEHPAWSPQTQVRVKQFRGRLELRLEGPAASPLEAFLVLADGRSRPLVARRTVESGALLIVDLGARLSEDELREARLVIVTAARDERLPISLSSLPIE